MPKKNRQHKIVIRELKGYNLFMIKSFTHKGLEKFYRTGSKAGVQAKHSDRLRLILAQLNQANTIQDMDIPFLKLHELKGDRKGMHSALCNSTSKLAYYFSIS